MTEIVKFLNKMYRNKIIFGSVLLIIGLILGIIGNYLIYKDIWKSLTNTISYFGLNVPGRVNFFIAISFIFIAFVLFLGAIIAVLRKKFHKWYAKNLMKDENILVFGYSDISKTFLENFKDKRNVVVVDEKDDDLDDDFWAKGYGFLKGDITNDEFFKLFDFEKTTDVLIVSDNDRKNIDVALKVLKKLDDVKTPTKIILHVNNTKLIELFYNKAVLEKNKNRLVDLKVFSFDVEVADDLFEEYTDFIPIEYFNNVKNENLKIAIVGNSDISLNVLKKIFATFVFPNGLKTEIYLIDENEDKFLEKVKYELNYSEEKFPHIILKTKKLDFEPLKNKEFFEKFDSVVIAYKDEDRNLEIAIDLYRNIFIRSDLKYPKIYFCIFREYYLSHQIDENKQEFARFFTFGNMKKIFTKENLLDDEKFDIAKKIHYGYGDVFDENKKYEDKKEINKKWYDGTKYSDKLSNIVQYEHLRIKLKFLGLDYKKSNLKEDELLEKNKKVFYEQIKPLMPFDFKELKDVSCEVVKNWDGAGDVEKINKFYEKVINAKEFYNLINTEHNRWNSYHFVNGWEKGKKDKVKKIHNCLVKLDENFPAKDTIIYDIYAYLYIPNILASSGYEIVRCCEK